MDASTDSYAGGIGAAMVPSTGSYAGGAESENVSKASRRSCSSLLATVGVSCVGGGVVAGAFRCRKLGRYEARCGRSEPRRPAEVVVVRDFESAVTGDVVLGRGRVRVL